MPNAFCTECGAERTAGKAFCTSCGARHAVPTPAPAVQPPRPTSQPRRLRCVECGSEIETGLVCARCAGGARTAVPDARGTQASPTPPVPRTADVQAKKATYAWGRIAAGIAVSVLFRLCLDVDWGKKLTDFKEAFSHGIDGTYVWQSATDASTWSRIRIDGERATVSDSTGWEDSGRVDRTGDTIRFANDLSSSGRAQSDPSKVDLGTLVQDGQAIEFDADGRTMRFVRQ